MHFWKKSALIFGLVGSMSMVGCGGEQAPSPEGTAEESRSARPELPEGAQAVSFLGEPLYAPDRALDVRRAQEEQLAEALADLEADPQSAEALIWAGRRHAYLGDYRKAIELFTIGMATHPRDARFYRHRGHRLITVRELDRALGDFRTASGLIEGTEDEVEPDGQPNAMGIPTSTLHFNIWYHYGLAHFLKGEFEEAAWVYEKCMDASVHADSKIATAHWWYMALRRAGREEEAQTLIDGLDLDALGSEVIESGSYLELLRLYASSEGGEEEAMAGLDPESLEGATLGYGIGNFYLYNGQTEEAREVFEGIVAAKNQWGAFGYIAAEADLARMGAG
jgi:tetratricopeptide (TPR) repeat protein